MAQSTSTRSYRYYDFVMAAFVTVLLCSNIIGVGKVATVAGFTFGAGTLFFPISYVFGDILTEVYGYARARRVVWVGFGAMIFAAFMSWFIVQLPPAQGWTQQEAYATIFGQTPRIVAASVFAFWAGELCNSYVLAKMKVRMKGKHLWARTIGSTMVGEAVDSVLFFPLAFIGTWPNDLVVTVMLTNFSLKVGTEVIMTPITYKVVGFLKKREQEDYYDTKTNFTPFSLQT